MAKALICDFCKEVFESASVETGTGHWSKVDGTTDGNRQFRFVWAVFELRTEAEKAAERGGKALDVCTKCASGLLVPQ